METKILNYFRRFLNKEALSVNLHNLITDSTEGLQSLDIGKPLDPFEFMYRIIYQLSHRTLSCNDVADDPVLLEKSLKQYLRLDEAVALEVIFPKLPVPSRLRKMWSGLQMHLMFKKVMDERRRTGHVGTDTMQTLMDAGESDTDITTVRLERNADTGTDILLVHHICLVCRSDKQRISIIVDSVPIGKQPRVETACPRRGRCNYSQTSPFGKRIAPRYTRKAELG